jgi:hypothetical protein
LLLARKGLRQSLGDEAGGAVVPLLRMLIEKSLHNPHCVAPRGVFGQASVVAIEAVVPSRDLSDCSHIAVTE